ncbi:Gfo/Idh/MocA family protein [Bacillus daqingensis]|uniref:Gfo/Idh/MocA family protein n=1 Tax=Bacillus daqingensis TaxID=872396 RepID=A0ABV9NWJ5_9BACI
MTYRIGIVGPGMIATSAHIPALLKDFRAEIAAVTSRTHETAQKAAERFHIPGVYTSEADMYEKEQLDLVLICVPNAYHAASVRRAFEAGVHVFCEKPPAMNAAEASLMETAAADAERHLMYGFHHRFQLETIVLKKAVDSGELGDIYHMNVQAVRRRGIPGWGSFTDKEKQGGGPLIDVGVHMLDLAAYISGFQTPVEVMGVTHQRLGRKPGVGLLGDWDPHTFSVEDFASGMIRFENGSSLVLETSYAANTAEEERLNVSFFGDEGGADTSPFRMYGEKYGALLDTTPVFLDKMEERDAYDRQLAHVLDVLDKKAAPAPASQGTYIQQLVDAFYESAATGRAVSFR